MAILPAIRSRYRAGASPDSRPHRGGHLPLCPRSPLTASRFQGPDRSFSPAPSALIGVNRLPLSVVESFLAVPPARRPKLLTIRSVTSKRPLMLRPAPSPGPRPSRAISHCIAISRDNPPTAPHSTGMRRFLPLVILVALAVAGFEVVRSVGWDGLGRHQAQLEGWVTAHPYGSAAIYLLTYTAAVAVSLPNAGLLTVTGGLLFGKFIGCALTVSGATVGATILMLIVRSAFGQTLDRRARPLRLRPAGHGHPRGRESLLPWRSADCLRRRLPLSRRALRHGRDRTD